MKKTLSRSLSPANRPLPSLVKRRRWPWLAGAALGLALIAGAAWFWSTDPTAGMVWIPPGEFWMGSDEFPDAKPVHRCYVDGFWMDKAEVTNQQFAAFVAATGYKTIAERLPEAKDFPQAAPEELQELRQQVRTYGSISVVFSPPGFCPPEARGHCDNWWKPRAGACWKHPEGPGSTIEGREKHPVVHIAWHDAVAYAEWAGKRLPTEAEWERAARGGLDRKPFYWGDELKPGGKWMANVWQGDFPCENTAADGYAGTAPVGSYPANAFGLYDMSGNVWEWCSDWYRPGYDMGAEPSRNTVTAYATIVLQQQPFAAAVCSSYCLTAPRRNPAGPASSVDTHGRNEPKRVQRGGSFLCSDSYCMRYRAGGRMEGEPNTSLAHTGFRCVLSPRGKK